MLRSVWTCRCVCAAVLATVGLHGGFAPAQSASSANAEIAIRGVVRSSDGKAVADAVVRLEPKGSTSVFETKTDAAGAFMFSRPAGNYLLSAEKSGLQSRTVGLTVPAAGEAAETDLVLDSISAHQDAGQGMAFSDAPNFTVAGVTDWTAVGGHGSDASLRTSETLASETVALKGAEPASVADTRSGNVSTAQKENADAHRRAGESAEKASDPLRAVHEYEEALHIDPSEENYFALGSELLVHRALWQAEQVFQQGTKAHPQSVRMLTGDGTALFAGARYDEAAAMLCRASDLDQAAKEPYAFMGRIQIAAPNPLPCVEEKLARFVQLRPNDSDANYLYAMAILKREERLANKPDTEHAEGLLTKAAALDPKCSDAYLELGILSSQQSLDRAIGYYTQAIAADPQSGDAHYRLGVAYDRIGEHAKAQEQFRLHDEIKKQQADAVEKQRRAVKQFVVAAPAPPEE